MILPLVIASVIPAQLVVNGQWVDTLRPGWRVKAGLESPPQVNAVPLQGDKVKDSASALQTASVPALNDVRAMPLVAPTNTRDTTGYAAISDTLWVPSLSVRQVEIKDLLPALALQHGVNIVLDPSVVGKVTLNLKKVRFRDVVRLLAEDLGLDVTAAGGVLKMRKHVDVTPLPPAPVCNVLVQDGLVSLDVQGATLDQTVRVLGQKAGMNIVVREQGGTPVRLLLKGLPPKRVLAGIAEVLGFELREQAGVFTLSRPDPPVTPATNQAGSPSGPLRIWVESDSTVSIEANQASLGSAVSLLASRLSLNIVTLGSLQGQVTLRLTHALPERVLDFLFAGSEYTWWKRDGAWVVGPAGSPGVANSELLSLKHVKAEDALELIPQSIQKNAQLKLVKSLNGIMVLGSRESIEGLRTYLIHLDKPVPQILIEALVVDIDMDKVRNIGVRAFLGKAGIGSNSRNIYPNTDMTFDAWDIDWALKSAGVGDVVKLPDDFFLKVNALEQEKLLQVRSRPQISTLNGSEAKLSVGQTQYYLLNTETNSTQTTTSTISTTQRFERIEANVTLTVTPYVSGEGEITCDITPDFSEPEGTFDPKTPPTINHRVFKSKVRLRDGETIILGGLVKESLSHLDDQVPLLGSIPIIGYLFKNRSMVKSRSQLMIFVTPHIYYGEDARVDPDKVMESFSK